MVKLHGLSEMPRYSLQDWQGVRDLVNLVNPSWTSLMRLPTHKHVQPAFTLKILALCRPPVQSLFHAVGTDFPQAG